MPADAPNTSSRPDDRPAGAPGWRVEGAPPGPGGAGPRRPRPAWLRFGWMLVLLLALNWVVSSFLLAPPTRTPVSYTFFSTQVSTNNIADITSTGDTIEGTF